MTSTERWPAILLQLHSDEWVRAVDVADALGVSERTVYRDVHDMVEAGIPVRGVPGHGYRLPESYLLSPIRLTVDEAVMIVLGTAQAARRVDGRYRAAAKAASSRIDGLLPDDVDVDPQSLRGSSPRAPSTLFRSSGADDLLPALAQAISEDRTVSVALASTADGSASRSVDPYGLVHHGTDWFLVGRDHARKRVVQVRLDELDAVVLTGETFERPASYGRADANVDVDRQQEVRVQFSEAAAEAAQNEGHVDVLEREWKSDGQLELVFRVDDASDVLPWLLSWGRHVQVLEPRSLRDRMATEAEKMARQYESVPGLLD